jgi:hypothetical protein
MRNVHPHGFGTQERAPIRGSIFFGEHDSEHSGGLRGIAWVFRSELTLEVVIVDLPEVLLPYQAEAAEIMLSVWIILDVERREFLNPEQQSRLYIDRQLSDSGRHYDPTADEGGAKVVVEQPNAAAQLSTGF